MMPSWVSAKLRRLHRGSAPRLLDLFAGCGGISTGFQAAGFEIVGGVEIDPHASRSHALNFFGSAAQDEFEHHAQPVDITAVEPAELIRNLGYSGSHRLCVDVVAGGPPCQAFARVGRAKLREVAEHPEAYKLDPRGDLYLRYLHFVKELKPLALLMENVPDVINYGGHNVPEETCEFLDSIGYVAKYTLLNAAFYGVPQMRERMFLLAYAKEVADNVQFPKPTHWIDLPRGYESSRQVALKNLKEDLFTRPTFYLPPPPASKNLPPAVSAFEALQDLPPIDSHLKGLLKRGAKRLNEMVYYPSLQKLSKYAQLMRTWPGFESEQGVSDHVTRYLTRDYPIFAKMNPGDQYPEAHKHAVDMFNNELGKLRRKGCGPENDSPEYQSLWDAIVPPYDPGKFPNKWRKMEADLPARTLMAHLGKDGYSHIHYDSTQARTISVREAARLQSFPDGFKFSGTMNPAFKQIGNAVPPLMARALAGKVFETLRRASTSANFQTATV